MKKTLLILGILLTLANDVSSSDETSPISQEPQSLIFPTLQDHDKLTNVSDSIYSDNEVILNESGYKIVPGYIPNWIWADGTPLAVEESEILDTKFDPPSTDKTPDWFWADDNPLTSYEKTKMPKALNYSDWIPKINYGTEQAKINKPAKNKKKDEVFIIADHMRHNFKKEIIWTW